jgi:hypothetical protein
MAHVHRSLNWTPSRKDVKLDPSTEVNRFHLVIMGSRELLRYYCFQRWNLAHPFLELILILFNSIVQWITDKTIFTQSTDSNMPSQAVQITHFQDSNTVDTISVESSISSNLRNMVNTYPSQTPTNILTRNYKIAEIPWGPGVPTTTTLDFPKSYSPTPTSSSV